MPTPMRLAFYLDDGLICGGAERVARSLLQHWSDTGWETHLISRRGTEVDFYAQPQGVERSALITTPGRMATTKLRSASRWLPGRSLLRFVSETIRLRRRLSAITPDVAVAFLTPGNAKLLAAAFGLGCRVVVCERTDLHARKYPLMWRVLRRLLYPRADLVTANTPGSLSAMTHYVSRNRLVLLPNPVDLPSNDKLAAPGTSRRIVCAGRLISDKRHLLLIEAFAHLNGEHMDWHLDILGDGPLRGTLAEEIRQRGMQNRIMLHGNVHDVARYYRAAAIFVLPSAYEGTPNALLEAMAHAIPSIVSDSISCARHLVSNSGSGLTFASGSATDLARHISALAADSEQRKEMGLRARQSIATSDYAAAYAHWDKAILGISAPTRSAM